MGDSSAVLCKLIQFQMIVLKLLGQLNGPASAAVFRMSTSQLVVQYHQIDPLVSYYLSTTAT